MATEIGPVSLTTMSFVGGFVGLILASKYLRGEVRMTDYYIWKDGFRDTVQIRVKRLDEFGAFSSLAAAQRKVTELKKTPQFKDVILEVSDEGGFVGYHLPVHNVE